MTKFDSISSIYNAIENNEASFTDLLEYIIQREKDAWDSGYTAAENLYKTLNGSV